MTFRGWSVRFAVATALSVAAPLACAAASCDAMDPCAARECRIDAEIAQAKAKGNDRQLTSLERSRAELVHCDTEGLKQKRKVALEQAQRRIDQRAADLEKAEAIGNASKIKKAHRKLESARKAYAEIQSSPL